MSHSGTINHDLSEPHSKAIGLWIVVTTMFLALSVGVTIVLYRSTLSRELDRKENVPVSGEILELRLYEKERLNPLKWIDRPQGVIQLPIDQAMTHVVQRYNRR